MSKLSKEIDRNRRHRFLSNKESLMEDLLCDELGTDWGHLEDLELIEESVGEEVLIGRLMGKLEFSCGYK